MLYPKIPRPSFLQPGQDDLNTLLASQDSLIKEGIVVLGAVVQANELLFHPGPLDHPGELLICLDPEIPPEDLRDIAHDIYLLKGESWRDQARAEFSNYLGNEMIRVCGLKVPDDISRGHECFCTTTLFCRQSLPEGILSGNLMPVLVHPGSLLAIVLPSRYWTEAGFQQFSP